MTRYTIQNPPTGLLKLGDEVLFTVDGEDYLHEVRRVGGGLYLSLRGLNNGTLFDLLGLNKVAICYEAYGTSPLEGNWPETKPWDFAALTRLVWKLYGIIAARVASTACPACNGPEKAPSAPQEQPEELKVGDWVVCLSGTFKWRHGKVTGKASSLGDVPLKEILLETGEYVRGSSKTFKRIEPWERFKGGDRVKGKEFGFREDVAGVIFQFDPNGSNNSHWRVETDTGERYWLLDDTIERVPPSKPAFRVKGEGEPDPNVTEIYPEEDGDDVNIVATREGRSQIIAYIKPDEVNGGKGKLMRCRIATINELQLVDEED
jgi:hypothetical protein